MSAEQNAIPERFKTVADPELTEQAITVLRPESFARGAVAVFHSMRKLGSGDRAFEVYGVESKAKPGTLFGVRRTAKLDRLLEGVQPGEEFYIRYDGPQENPNIKGGIVHVWTIAREPGRIPVVPTPAAVGDAHEGPAAGAPALFE